jgi:hypothetical protein
VQLGLKEQFNWPLCGGALHCRKDVLWCFVQRCFLVSISGFMDFVHRPDF